MSTFRKYKRRILLLLKNFGWRYTYHYLWFTFVNFHMVPATAFKSKKLRNLWFKIFSRIEPYPRFIEVETTTNCGLRCVMCEHTYWKEKNKNMTFKQFKYIVDQFPKLYWIGVTGIGESYLNPDFNKMLRYIKKERKAYIEMYDNMFYMNDKDIEELVKLKVDKLIISIDACTKKTYEKIRKGSNFERVVKNIKKLHETKKRLNSDFPEIDFHFIVSKYNIHEILPYIDFVKSLGVEDYTEILFTTLLHRYKEVKNIYVTIPKSVVNKANKRAEKLKIRLIWNRNVPPPTKRCHVRYCTAWTEPFFFVTGHVTPCCALNEANEREFQKNTSFGNIFEKPFKEIWDSPGYKRLRREIRSGKLPYECRHCTIYHPKGIE